MADRRVCKGGRVGEVGSGERKSRAGFVDVKWSLSHHVLSHRQGTEHTHSEYSYCLSTCAPTRLSRQPLLYWGGGPSRHWRYRAGMQGPYPEEVSRQPGREADTYMINASAVGYTQSLGNRGEMINFLAIHYSAASGKFPFSFPHFTDWCLFFLRLTGHSSKSSSAPPSSSSHSLSDLIRSHQLQFHVLGVDCRVSLCKPDCSLKIHQNF